ncbi:MULTISPECIES: hypothetical protein [unclassified Lysinibacillus]|uniref:hypothetical protein n=1 Tax=unclassified Lysinibacillus TaxID=2636778 RepID=UPI003801E429
MLLKSEQIHDEKFPKRGVILIMIKNIFSLIIMICGLLVGLTLLDIIHLPLFFPYAGIIISTTVILIILFKNRRNLANNE